MFYDARFYEFQALQEQAKIAPIKINVRLPHSLKRPKEWPEVDGIQEIDGDEWVIEIKSEPLDKNKMAEVLNDRTKLLKTYGFHKLRLIAPRFEKTYDRVNDIEVECVEFVPNIKLINDFYANWSPQLPERFAMELRTGWHNFRYRMAKRAKKHAQRFLNQVDKRISSIKDLKEDILRLSQGKNPPVKVYWSALRYLDPKQLYYRKSSNYVLGGLLVFDVDGLKIHYNMFPCTINGMGICEYCVRFSKMHLLKLMNVLEKEYKFSDFEIVFTGRKGFHLYVFDAKETTIDKQFRSKVLHRLRELRIKVDEAVTADLKRVISFPTSLNAETMFPISILNVEHIDSFSPAKIRKWED